MEEEKVYPFVKSKNVSLDTTITRKRKKERKERRKRAGKADISSLAA